MTLLSVVLSVLVTMSVHGWRFDSSGVRIAVLVPLIIAPLFSYMQLSMISQLEKIHDNLQQLSITDELTQTFNRRHFMAVAEQTFARACRDGHGFSLILFDADDFKKINDVYGHQMGDRVLKHIAAMTCTNVRAGDLVARYGGEEFIVLLPEASMPKAVEVAQRVHDSIAHNSVQLDGKPVFATVSMGVASYKPTVSTLDDLLSQADHALYKAKKYGKNRIERMTVA